MIKFIRKYLWTFYLGVALNAFADLTALQWKFWAIGLPVIILVGIRKEGGSQ